MISTSLIIPSASVSNTTFPNFPNLPGGNNLDFYIRWWSIEEELAGQ